MAKYLVICKPGIDPRNVAGLVNSDDNELFSKLWNGFTSELTGPEVAFLREHRGVESVTDISGSAEHHGARTTARGGSRWYLEALSSLTYRGQAQQDYTGAGVHVYLIDSGIDFTNPEFGGRASLDYSWLGSGGNDTTGHGSACAALIGGVTRGIAPGVTLHALQTAAAAPGSSGTSTFDALFSAMEWIAVNAQPQSVINMSFGALTGGGINTAVARLTALGHIVVASAGNSREDVSGIEPASAPEAITVGGINIHGEIYDNGYSGTNYGTGVDVMAPGQDMDTLSIYTSGTSFSAPIVCGLIARFIEAYGTGYSPAIIRDWLVRNGTPGPVDPLTPARPPIVSSRGL